MCRVKLTGILILAILLTACTGGKPEKQTAPPDETAQVKMYRFFDADGLMACEYNTVSISRTHILADTIKNLGTGIKLKNLFYEGTRLIVDLDPAMAEVMDWGSFGGQTYFNAILYTFASYPGVTEIKVLIDGAEDIEGSHFSFRGTFPAEVYLHYSVNNNIQAGEASPQVQDFIFNGLLYARTVEEIHKYDLAEYQIDEIRSILQTSAWKIGSNSPETGFYSNYYGLLIQDKAVAFINLYNNQTLIILKNTDTGGNIAVYWAPPDIHTNIGIYISSHF